MPLSSTFLALHVAASAVLAPAQMEWRPTLDAAMEEAKRDGKPVFIAINMDNERANDEAVRSHYKDSLLNRLAQNSVVLFASKHDHESGDRACSRGSVVTCEQHMQVEKDMRKRFLQSQGDSVIAPQHLWIDPDGNVILSVPYRISKGEMEWCFVTALRKLDPDFRWTFSGGARAPRRLVMEGVVSSSLEVGATPPTRKEVVQIIEELRKVRRPWEQRSEVLRLMLSSDKKAIEFIRTLVLARGGGGRRGGGRDGARWKASLLHDIGRYAPEEYWQIVVPLLSDNEVQIRREASVALEQLAAPKALNDLLKQFKKEEEVGVRKELIRAIASCGRASGKARKVVTQNAEKSREELLRANAMVGVADLKDRDAVLEVASSGLLSEMASVRAAAGYVVAVRRELSLEDKLAQAVADESDAAVKEALQSAMDVLKGGMVTDLNAILSEFAGSDIPRDRV